jgi:hypothetical protein
MVVDGGYAEESYEASLKLSHKSLSHKSDPRRKGEARACSLSRVGLAHNPYKH